MNKPQPLFTLCTNRLVLGDGCSHNYHELRCTKPPSGAEYGDSDDVNLVVSVRFTRQYGRDEEFLFKIGVMDMGEWNEVVSNEVYRSRRQLVEDNEGHQAALDWAAAFNNRYLVDPSWGDTMSYRALKIGNEAIEKFEALLALGIFDVGITL